MRRLRHVAALIAVAAVALAGCTSGRGGQGGQAGGSESATTRLSFVMWGDGGEATKSYQEVITRFEAQHPDIKINFETFNTNDYDTVLKTRLAGGAGPDIYGFDQKNLIDFINAGYTTDLSKESWFSSLSADTRKEATRNAKNGEANYVPISQSGNGIVYNADLFEKAGITEEPTTYDELVAAAKKLKDAGITPFAMSAQDNWWPQFIVYYAVAENVFEKDPDFNEKLISGAATFSGNEGWRRSLEIYRELVPYYMDNPLGTNQTAAKSAFMQGKAAMFPAAWILPDVREAKLNAGYMNFPTTNATGTKAMWGSYLVSLGVNPNNKKTKEANRFLSFFFTDDVYLKFLGGVKAFPVKEGLDVSSIDPLYPDMQKSWEGRTFVPLLLPSYPAIQETLLVELQNLTGDRSDVTKVLNRLDETMKDIRAGE
ncbi:hypothetical protein GCM10010517_41510 [Streptosporangium fragile]|uniref:Sugar ABC transporter substrate-binding protein n=1 Tax=Streptosporangium fragile TaxID=46186 RepID=A0ABP6IIS7_9ACTN